MINETFWCKDCNVPLISKTCGICGKRGEYCSTGLKPVFPEERNFFIKELNTTLPFNLFRSRNRLIVDGKVLLSFYMKNRSLQFFNKELVENSNEMSRKEFLKRMIKANKKELEKKENEAIEFIKKTIKKHKDKKILVSFSGGKDSTVTAYLVSKVMKTPTLLFGNTGIEFPETIKFVRKFAKLMNFNLIERNPPKNFIDLCDDFGPPSRMMRWCCSTQKAAAISSYYTEIDEKILSFDGIRSVESKSRAKFKRSRDNTKLTRQYSAYPIFNWSDLEIWLYILYRNMPVNPLYSYGFNRVGCWACPNNGVFDSFLTEKIHPEIINVWRKFLLDYAKKNNRTEDWVYNNQWKERKVKYEKFEVCSVNSLCSTRREYSFNLKGKVSNEMIEFFKIFGKTSENIINNKKWIKIEGKNITVSSLIGHNKILVRFNDEERFNRMFFLLEKQLTKSVNCVRCGACIGSCPFGAIEVNGSFKINEDKCVNCQSCATSKNLKMTCAALHYKTERNVIEKLL